MSTERDQRTTLQRALNRWNFPPDVVGYQIGDVDGFALLASKIEEFVVEQIKRIGSDAALCDETFRQVQDQVAAERRALKAETKRVERELATLRAGGRRLTSTMTMATGAAADPAPGPWACSGARA